MLSYCLKCRKNTESKSTKFIRTKIGRKMLLLNSVVCNSEKSKFIKEQETSRIISSLGIKIPLNKFPFIGPLLF